VRIRRAMTDHIDALAEGEGRNRSNMIRRLLAEAIKERVRRRL